MHIQITETMFKDQFVKMGRGESFSHNGLTALYEYFEQLEDDMGKSLELDVIAICCEFGEYTDIEEIAEVYTNIEDIDDLRNNTTVIEFDGGLIIGEF